ncbi:MAG: polyphenol oxidase family protein [Solirubrobacteraceae bacterium]
MKLPEPFYVAGEHIGIDLAGARVVFSTRRGGCSRGPYESLNLGFLTGDERSSVEANREALADALGVGFAYARQVHGAQVAVVERITKRGPGLPDADGQATAATGVAPMVLTADCLAVAVAGEGAVAMLHAGWRGLAAGVIGEGVRALRELGATGQLQAAIGAGAGVCCYEVGEEVHAALHSAGRRLMDAANGPDLRYGAHADLKLIARRQLEAAGVQLVHDLGICTICCEPSLFFSHRRERGVTGRQAGVAWLI